METFAQQGSLAGTDCNRNGSGHCASITRTTSTVSCQTCHASAAIARAGRMLPDGHPLANFATDYSFVFQGARPAGSDAEK
jgi:hypothetical protein